jgi:tetratricopeptide (TPR) repeat protein
LFAQERGADEDSPPERSAALSRVIDASLDLAQRADRRMSTDFLGAAGHRAVGWNLPVEVAQQLTVDPGGWFDRERGFLVATVSDGLQAGMAGRAGGLAAALTSLFEVRNHFADWRRVQTSSLSGALRAGDRHTAMRLHRGLGELDTIQDHYTEAIAHFEAALGLGDVVDPAHESALTAGLGYLHRMKGRYEPAIHYFTRARGLAEEAGNRQGLVYAVNNIGVVHLERGELVPAIVCFSQCLQLSQELEYLPGQAQSLRGLGHVRRAEQDDDAAAELYQRAARISRSLGDRLGEAHALCWLGKVFIRQGRHGHARRLLSRCLWVYREFGNAWGEAATLWILADAQLAVGRLRPARLRAGQAVAIWRGIASPYWLTQGLHTLAAAYEHEGDTVAAQGLRQQAAALRAEQGLSRIEA